MSVYTDAASRPGLKSGASDPDELFLTEFGELVLTAYLESLDYQSLVWSRTITQGKADSFPIIGRKRSASEHAAGEIILGGTVEHNEVVITVDPPLVDSVFIADYDELRLHYDLQGPYATQLGQSIGVAETKRIAQMHILASRNVTPPYTDAPVPSYYYHANIATDASKLEEAYFAAKQHIEENNITKGGLEGRLPWQQYLLAARYVGIEGNPVTTGSGNRSTGTIGLMAGIPTTPTNHIPQENIVTGNAKYQGNFTTTIGHISTRMAVGQLNLRGLRVTVTPKEDRLGTLLIAHKISGLGKLRSECAFELASASR